MTSGAFGATAHVSAEHSRVRRRSLRPPPAPVGITVISGHCRFIRVNAGCGRLTRVSATTWQEVATPINRRAQFQ